MILQPPQQPLSERLGAGLSGPHAGNGIALALAQLGSGPPSAGRPGAARGHGGGRHLKPVVRGGTAAVSPLGAAVAVGGPLDGQVQAKKSNKKHEPCMIYAPGARAGSTQGERDTAKRRHIGDKQAYQLHLLCDRLERAAHLFNQYRHLPCIKQYGPDVIGSLKVRVPHGRSVHARRHRAGGRACLRVRISAAPNLPPRRAAARAAMVLSAGG